MSTPDFEVVTDWEALSALAAEWDDLFERVGRPEHVFQRFDLLALWARHYAEPRHTPHVLVARCDGVCVAIVPLVRCAEPGITRLRFMGAPIAQIEDLLIDPADPALPAALMDRIRCSGADVLDTRLVRDDADLRRLIPVEPHVTFRSPYADLAVRVAEDDGPSGAYSRRTRANHRRRLRRLGEVGPVALRRDPTPDEAETLAEAAIDLKVAALGEGTRQARAVADERFRAFFKDAARTPAVGAAIAWISVDDEPVAIEVSFDCLGTSFGHLLALDERLHSNGLGNLLIHHVFASARARGNRVFDMMVPAADFKMSHADGVHGVGSYLVPLTRRGALFLLGRRTAKSLAARVLPGRPGQWVSKHRS